MKKTILSLLTFALIFSSPLFAQKLTEGKVVYEISFPEMDENEKANGMTPTEATLFFKENLLRMEMKIMGMGTVVISNSKDKSVTTLMDLMGNKLAIKMTGEEMAKERSKMTGSSYQTRLTSETKDIAGYRCKKALATNKDGNEITIYCTTDIMAVNLGFAEQYKGIDGFPMEYQMAQNGMNMKFVAKNVTKQKVDQSKFVIPSDYKITTKEELSKMFGGSR